VLDFFIYMTIGLFTFTKCFYKSHDTAPYKAVHGAGCSYLSNLCLYIFLSALKMLKVTLPFHPACVQMSIKGAWRFYLS
jgi:hypothetical protein